MVKKFTLPSNEVFLGLIDMASVILAEELFAYFFAKFNQRLQEDRQPVSGVGESHTSTGRVNPAGRTTFLHKSTFGSSK